MLRLQLLVIGLLFSITPVLSQEKTRDSISPLEPFSRLIAGEWQLGDSYQVFEWGVGKLSVKSRNYFMVEGTPKLVSEGSWFWHPGQQQLKGYFTAINMPAVLFDYTTSFEGDKMVNELTTYTATGKAEAYSEVWDFVDKDTYRWTLYNMATQEPQKLMEGTYRRKMQNE